jgi:oligopeptide transport system substrate-binding protein
VEWKTILSRRKKKEFEILAGSWIADYGDPNGFLDIFCPDAQNIPGYNNPQYAQLIKKAEHTFNPIQRHTLFQKAEAILLKDKPVIPIYHTATPTLVNKKRIQGWCNNAHGFHPSWDLTCKIN